MEKKKEIKKDSLIKEKESIDSISGKVLVVQSSTKPDDSELNYLINTDGLIDKFDNINDNINICLLGSTDINWTQKESLVNLVRELQSKGAGSIRRYDDFDAKEINPVFDLNNVMIKYSIK